MTPTAIVTFYGADMTDTRLYFVLLDLFGVLLSSLYSEAVLQGSIKYY